MEHELRFALNHRQWHFVIRNRIFIFLNNFSRLFESLEPIVPVSIPISSNQSEQPPGRAAQLGMGLGITFFVIIVVVEVLFLYRKYGSSRRARDADYQMPSLTPM